jgi:hypothetical protein
VRHISVRLKEDAQRTETKLALKETGGTAAREEDARVRIKVFPE